MNDNTDLHYLLYDIAINYENICNLLSTDLTAEAQKSMILDILLDTEKATKIFKEKIEELGNE